MPNSNLRKLKTSIRQSWIIEGLRLGGHPMILLDTHEPQRILPAYLRRRSKFRRSRQWFTSAESLEQISQRAKWSRARPPRTYPKRKRLYGGNLAPSTVYYADTWAGIIAWYRAGKTGTLYIIPCVACLMVNDGPASYRVARFRALRDATQQSAQCKRNARCVDVRDTPVSSPIRCGILADRCRIPGVAKLKEFRRSKVSNLNEQRFIVAWKFSTGRTYDRPSTSKWHRLFQFRGIEFIPQIDSRRRAFLVRRRPPPSRRRLRRRRCVVVVCVSGLFA